jgi:toxin-antitoxin system PIN domain toxin
VNLVALLDTNVLLALAWPNHQHHVLAHSWFKRGSRHGWATCAFTQLGFIRLSSNPAFSADAVLPREAACLLQQWVKMDSHHFWKSPEAAGETIYEHVLGHQQVNDAWLVEVARVNKGKLVTLDSRILAHATKKKGQGLVEVIEAA